ncbi:LacI family DNA-binding transcriptional regulator [Microlunatus sp. GCM10028923]|uniref:LacI family DNA-binding transcriptional regulator n=1 Tax=Microlunatus sp. GCM10028923 TaxID=3273400 RepID=UPI0036208C96
MATEASEPEPAAVRAGPKGRRATITDVAAAAGASRSTTSRALSGQGYVSPEVRDRVQRAARSLGYVPDALARGLKRRSSTSIGVLVSDLSNVFYAQLAAGASRRAKELGFTTLLADTQGQSKEELAAAQAFLELRVAGVVVTPVSARISGWLVDHEIPTVELDRSFGRAGVDSVAVDNFRASEAATAHLVGLGHRRIALLIDETDWTTGRRRYEGYRSALQAAGLKPNDADVVASGWDATAAGETTRALLRRRRPPTAIFAANNLLAEGAWRAVHEAGLRVPRDLSLIGFDDAPWMTLVQPAVSTVVQNAIALGEAAMSRVVDRIGRPGEPRQEVVLGAELQLRGSTARAPR